jgi:uncharacterized protein
MKAGDIVQVHFYKSDGTRYRAWAATVEAVLDDCLAVTMQPGTKIEMLTGDSEAKFCSRSTFFYDKPFFVLELYDPADGRLVEIYVNINSPIELEDHTIRFVDYELDVSLVPPGMAVLVDEDEFAEAVEKFGYSAEFQQFCYTAAQEAIHLANNWVAKGMP